MMPPAHPLETEGVVSELATLSSDPTLANRPDPTFRPKFRNADEVIDIDFRRFDMVSRRVIAFAPTWTGTTLWRRSPKD
jgi:hypothetical protein